MVGQLHKGLQIVMDGNYCRQVSDWTRTKQGQMVAHGYHTGGVPAYGFRSETVPKRRYSQTRWWVLCV
ncbi:MAG: hypothetical protein NTX57_00555 [Armatimonadetes bacterium]|jgi:hypothetical protein|nr:hypothetical protein [Armatimonadota bacterium]